jgi:hypothetical protein
MKSVCAFSDVISMARGSLLDGLLFYPPQQKLQTVQKNKIIKFRL